MAGHYRTDHFPVTRVVESRERVENYDVIRRHDHAVMNYFQFWMPYEDLTTGRLMEKLVPMVFATPRREFSEKDINVDDETRYTAQEWEGEFEPTQHERIVYPSIAVTRLDTMFDNMRFTYGEYRKLLYSSDLNLTLQAPFPLPYTFSYQFDFWVEEQSQLNAMAEQWIRKFPRPTWWVDVQYPPPWGTQSVHMQANPTFSNASILEGSEQNRELRGVATLNLFGWIPLPPSWVRTVQKLTLEIIEQSSEEILEIYETEYASKADFWETGDQEQVLVWK